MELKNKHFWIVSNMCISLQFTCRTCHYSTLEDTDDNEYSCELMENKNKTLYDWSHYCRNWEKKEGLNEK